MIRAMALGHETAGSLFMRAFLRGMQPDRATVSWETILADTLEMNLCGRILLRSRLHGITDPRRVAVLARSVVAVIENRYPEGRPSLLELEPLITEQLALLEAALVELRMRTALGGTETSVEPYAPAPPPAPVEEPSKKRLRKRTLKGKGYTVQAKSMEEKLREGRVPVQELLQKDCVQLGLVTQKQAKRLVRGMLGKHPEDAEQEIVEHLRQILQDQVKGIIRRLKGGPWRTPQAQEEMRQDIHSARSVKSILMLARQIAKERAAWEKQHGGGGLLAGLFGGRH